MDRKLQRHRADSLRQHGFLVLKCCSINISFLKTACTVYSVSLKFFVCFSHELIAIMNRRSLFLRLLKENIKPKFDVKVNVKNRASGSF